MKNYKKSPVWQKSSFLTQRAYKATAPMQKELLGYGSQVRHAFAFIPAAIATGHSNDNENDRKFCYKGAIDSLFGLKSLLANGHSRGILNGEHYNELIKEIDELNIMLQDSVRN